MPLTRHVERHFTSGEAVRDIVIGMSEGLTGWVHAAGVVRVRLPGSRERCMWTSAEPVRSVWRRAMLYTIGLILLILWLLGVASGYTTGAFIHVLLVVGLVLFLVGSMSGRRVV